VLAGLPFAIAEEFDPGAVHQNVERPARTAIRDVNPGAKWTAGTCS
jgi:hypothetical protein